MRRRRPTIRALLLGAAAAALVAGVAYAQVPPIGSGVVGWLQAIYNTLGGTGTTVGPRANITASNTGTTAGVTATLAAVAGKTTYICGFSITANATAGTSVAASVTGTITGTLNFIQGVGVLTAPAAPLTVPFTPCVPASAANTSIAVNSGAAGSGGLAAVTAWGYQQ